MNNKINKAIGIKWVISRDWKKLSEWNAAIAKHREYQNKLVVDRFIQLTERATDVIEECLNSENDAVKLKAATWVLERGEALHI